MSEKKDEFELDVTNLEEEGKTQFSKKITLHKEKANQAFQSLLMNLKTEATETQEATKILVKFIKEGSVSKEEEKELRTQVYDLLKVLGIGVPFALIPGASLLLPFLIKLAKEKGIQILPTAFNEGKDNE